MADRTLVLVDAGMAAGFRLAKPSLGQLHQALVHLHRQHPEADVAVEVADLEAKVAAVGEELPNQRHQRSMVFTSRTQTAHSSTQSSRLLCTKFSPPPCLLNPQMPTKEAKVKVADIRPKGLMEGLMGLEG